MDLEAVRTELGARAENALLTLGIEDEAVVHTGSRQVLYKEGELPLWEFGVAIVIEGRFEQAVHHFDPLLTGPYQVKDSIEVDRTLSGLVIDCDVTSVRGPQRGDGSAITEWVVQIRAEEE